MLGTREEEGTLPRVGAPNRVLQGEKELARSGGWQEPPAVGRGAWTGGFGQALKAGKFS